MANKRNLKKRIHRVCGEAAIDVLFNLPYEIANKMVLELAELQSQSLANATFSFDRSHKDFADKREYNKARTQYNKTAFRKLNSDFKNNLQAIVDEINKSLRKDK